MTESTPKPLVLGLGNACRRDDGVGRFVARELAKMGLNGVTIEEASGEGTALMEAWAGRNCVHLVDAVQAGSAPGTIHLLDAARDTIPSSFFHYSTHAFSLAEAVELARVLGQLPPRLIIHGIEGRDFSSGEGLSSEVAEAAARVVHQIANEFNPANPSKPQDS